MSNFKNVTFSGASGGSFMRVGRGQSLNFKPCPKCGSTAIQTAGISISGGKAKVNDPRCAACSTPLEAATNTPALLQGKDKL